MIRLMPVFAILLFGSIAYAQTTQPAVRKTYDAAPKTMIDVNKKYTAAIETDKGTITVELFAKDAPKTVNSFVFLSREHFYDGLNFHRVVANFVIQGGDPNGDGSGGPGYTVPLEAKDNPHLHDKGALAMARTSDPDSAGSQFYITLADVHFLDPGAVQPDETGALQKSPGYTVFGQVIDGKDVPEKIRQGDVIKTITVKEE